jgi:glycosyltransferase involved in cell wall biosynthesis
MTTVRRKVLFLVPSLAGGGAERVFSTLLRHLDRSRFEPHLGVLEAKGSYMGDIPDDVDIHVLNIPRVRYALPGIVKLAWTIKPQTILSTLAHLNLALMAGKPFLPQGCKLLIRESTLASIFLQTETSYPRFWRLLYRRLYPRSDKVVCPSDAIAHDLAVNFDVPREKLVRIYNPVDIESVERAAMVEQTPYTGPGPHLVSAGRLSREKGFDVLLDAMPAVLQRHPDAHLTILGEGSLRGDLTAQAQRLGLSERVEFAGFQGNPWAYLRHADVFVCPSRYEGMPNILLEAVALGTRAVAADCPGGVREIKDCDETIILVATEDSAALAEGIITACGQPNHYVEIEEREKRLEKFKLEKVVSQYSELF